MENERGKLIYLNIEKKRAKWVVHERWPNEMKKANHAHL